MIPKTVKINGEILRGFHNVTFEGIAPTQHGGYPGRSCTIVPPITLTRDIYAEQSTQGFDLATNGDGTVVKMELEIELQNAQGEVCGVIKSDCAYVQSFSISEDPDADTTPTETWIVRCAHVSYQADGKVASLELKKCKNVIESK